MSKSKLASIKVKGASGTPYIFHLYPWGTTFKPVGAVYVVTRRSEKTGGGFHHKRIHMGTTADLSQGLDQEGQRDKFERYSANCIWVHREKDQARRDQIQADLRSVR
jgi:hypothetical protein